MIKIYFPNDQMIDKSSQFRKPPTAGQLHQWLNVPPGYLELVHVLLPETQARAQMWVDESGQLRDNPIPNGEATKIYLYNSTRGDPAKMREAMHQGYMIFGNAVVLTDEHELD